jgi:acetylornithine deacetylase/succinyl-diaminopimelate desuccinylase-like protein
VTGSELRDETVDLLSRLIQVDTTNPPGNETAAAELLRDYLEASGVACELYAKVPERANLVARIPGGSGASLLFLSHTDVVLADPAEWSVPPFSGEVRNGEVWGRGALDMKSQVAASAVAVASLAREGFRPSGDLVFAACADEEVGDGFGLEWLCEEHPDAVRTAFAVNEGGGDRLALADGGVVYQATVAEKMTAPFLLRVHGRSGHASMPGIADNALVKAALLVERIAAFRPEPQLGPEVAGFLRAVLGDVPSPVDAVERTRALSPAAADHVEPMIRAVLGSDVDYDLEWIEARGGTRSPLDTPLWSALGEFVAETEPGARAAPFCCAGFTDSHWLREAFGTVAYGFFPASGEMATDVAASLVHSADERIPVADLELGVRWLRHAATAVLT